MDIVMASDDEVQALGIYIDRVLEALGYPEALITDESKVKDFLNWNGWATRTWKRGEEKKQIEPNPEAIRENKELLAKVSEDLKIIVNKDDYIVDVARRLKQLGFA